jgi:hypothetical protein
MGISTPTFLSKLSHYHTHRHRHCHCICTQQQFIGTQNALTQDLTIQLSETDESDIISSGNKLFDASVKTAFNNDNYYDK